MSFIAPLPPLRVELSWPARELSPNGRAHRCVVARFKKAAKKEGWGAAMLQMHARWQPSKEPVPIHIIAHPPEAWRTGDKDNMIASTKAHLDGIALALGINDRDFDAPTVEWADRCQRGKLIVVVG